MTNQVLHIDFVSLSEAASQEAIDALIVAASELRGLESVVEVGLIEADPDSDFELAVYFVLRSFADLEPFGTNPNYTRFLQGKVAPVLRGFGGASVELQQPFPERDGPHGACLALAAPEETYDFEVRMALEEWPRPNDSASSVVGLAIGERQRYRGCVMTFSSTRIAARRMDDGRFESNVIAGRSRRL